MALRNARLGLRALASARQAGAVRAFSEAAPAEEDFVFSVFKKQQQQFRALMEGLQSIPIPLGGDAKEIESYASKVEALKKKVGATTLADSLAEREATLASEAEDSDAPFETLLASLENARTGDADKDAALGQWAADVRALVGTPATEAEAAATAATLAARLEELTADVAEKKATVVDAYAQHVADIKASVDAELAKVQKDGGLEWVSVDLKNVAPKA